VATFEALLADSAAPGVAGRFADERETLGLIEVAGGI
jgi:hypothetical protein